MISGNKFDGIQRADLHDHIREFLAICDMFKYGETQSEAVKLLFFPFSLCDKAKTWFNELNEESITSWDQTRRAFISRFLPPSLFNRLLLKIRNFSQNICESLTDDWLRLKNMLRKCHGHGLTKRAIIQIFYHGIDESTQSLKEEMHEMRKNYNNHGGDHASKNDDTPMYERHEVNCVQSEDYQNRDSHDSNSLQSHFEQLQSKNDPEKSLTKLNNDVKNDLEDFKRCIHSMRTIHDKLFDRDDQSKTDLEKSITKFLDSQIISNMFVKNNVNDIIIKMKQNEKNCQTIYKNMERKIDEWEKYQNVSLEQTKKTDPPPPQAHTEHVNAVFTGSGKSDDSPKTQKDPPPPIIVNNKTKKDKPIKESKKGYHVFDRLADKQSGRPSGSLPSNTQPNPRGNNSKAYQPPQSRNEHVNAVFTRSGKSYDPPDNPNDQQNNSENPINFDSDDEDDEPTPQPKTQPPKP
ncbi:reverse transcriptase domain-containing protein, partial [Tanacetum coccineum]